MKVAASRIMPSPNLSMLRPLITYGFLHAVVYATSFGEVTLAVIRNAFMGMRRVIRLVLDELQTIEKVLVLGLQ